MRAQRRTRALIFGTVGAVAVALTLAVYAGHILRSLELKTVDTRFVVRGSQDAPSDLAVVQIDDVTFNDLRNSKRPAQWPFSRCYHASVIDRIAKASPRAIAVDIQFTEPSSSAACDNKLIEAVGRAGNVVLATTEVDGHGRTAIFGGDDVLKQLGARAGNAILPADSDGVIRHVPYATQGLTSFGIVAAQVAYGNRSTRDGGPTSPVPNGAGSSPIERPTTSKPWIDFVGAPGTISAYSYSRVLDGKVPSSAFRNKLVVIGPSATSLQDVHATAGSGNEVMSGAEIQANVAETAIHGFRLRSLAPRWEILLIVLFGLIAPVMSLRLRGWHSPALAVGIGVLYAFAAQLAFNHGRVVPLTYPLLALMLSAIGVLVAEYLLEAFERVRTHDTFSRFVPEAVVNQVLARTGGELRLGGELVEGTAMFTDLRGFTTFSEGLEAEEVIDLLNGYLGEISDAVLAHGGTLVSYLGDGLMAVFGAPLP